MHMASHLFTRLLWMFIGVVLSMLLARPVWAGIEVSVARAGLREAELEDGGRASAQRTTLALAQAWNFPEGGGVGLKLTLERETWDFGGGHRFGAAPWRTVEQGVVSLPMHTPLGAGFVLMLVPRLAWTGEAHARADDARTAGIIGAALKVFGPHRRLGLGVETVRTLEDGWELAPVLIVDWRFDERWRLFNPSELGPAGSAGLELACQLSPRVALGMGVAERERSFRLAADHAGAAGGMGEVRQVLGFLHLSWKASSDAVLHAYAGAVLAGELTMRDHAGHRLERDHMATAPVLGISGQLRF